MTKIPLNNNELEALLLLPVTYVTPPISSESDVQNRAQTHCLCSEPCSNINQTIPRLFLKIPSEIRLRFHTCTRVFTWIPQTSSECVMYIYQRKHILQIIQMCEITSILLRCIPERTSEIQSSSVFAFPLYPVADVCTKNPCKNGGTCSVIKNGYICKCSEKDVNELCGKKKEFLV